MFFVANWNGARMPYRQVFENAWRTSVKDNDLLTPREREVLTELIAGASNKEAGRHLGISPRTVEVHRARIMEKMGAKNAADLVRLTLRQAR